MRRLAALLAALVVVPLVAGCADKAETSSEEVVRPATTPPGTTAPAPTTTRPPTTKSPSERWHFHDHWQGSPVITLFEGEITLAPTVDDAGLPVLSYILALPRGVVVPAETGFLTINATWAGSEPGPVNVTYRPADTNDFQPFADLKNGEAVELPTTESMTDVPHRQETWWRFNFSASGAAMATAPRTFQVNISATIGRPLFIDPPHLNWWLGSEVIPLVESRSGTLAGAWTPVRNASLGALPPASPRQAVHDEARIGVDEGRIVPEGAKSVVVLLNWTSSAPDAKLTLRYREGNYPTEGAMPMARDGAGSRVFVLPVEPAMTDTTYSNRTTWEFIVLPEGDAAAFSGSFELRAWATRLEADAAAAALFPEA